MIYVLYYIYIYIRSDQPHLDLDHRTRGFDQEAGEFDQPRPMISNVDLTPGEWDTMWLDVHPSFEHNYPLVMTNIAIENGHRNSGFTHEKWWIFP